MADFLPCGLVVILLVFYPSSLSITCDMSWHTCRTTLVYMLHLMAFESLCQVSYFLFTSDLSYLVLVIGDARLVMIFNLRSVDTRFVEFLS